MITLAWLSLITMLLLSLVYLQTVISFNLNSPLTRSNIQHQQVSQRENILQPKFKNVLKGQRQEKSSALGVGAFGGGGMNKKSPGGFGGGGGGQSSFG